MIAIDPQVAAVRDDGTEQGIIRTELARGRLVAVPFRSGLFSTTLAGSGTASLVGTGFTDNDDGTQSGISVSVAASAIFANCAVLKFFVMGNVFGLRLDKRSAYAPNNPIGCLIDGVAYDITTASLVEPASQVAATYMPGLYHQIVANDLGDGAHLVELFFPAFASGATRSYGVLGYLADAKAGYTPAVRGVRPATVVALTTSFASLLPASVYGIRGVFFTNTTAGPITVNLRYNSGTPFWSKSIAANDTASVDLFGIVYDDLQASASANASINASVMVAL